MQQRLVAFRLGQKQLAPEDLRGKHYEGSVHRVKVVNREKRMRRAFGAKVFSSIHPFPVSKPYATNGPQRGGLAIFVERVVLINLEVNLEVLAVNLHCVNKMVLAFPDFNNF